MSTPFAVNAVRLFWMGLTVKARKQKWPKEFVRHQSLNVFILAHCGGISWASFISTFGSVSNVNAGRRRTVLFPVSLVNRLLAASLLNVAQPRERPATYSSVFPLRTPQKLDLILCQRHQRRYRRVCAVFAAPPVAAPRPVSPPPTRDERVARGAKN